MDSEARKEFIRLMTAVSELYGKTYSENVLQLYWNALAEYSIDEIKSAFNIHAKDTTSGQFFPKPADLIRHIDGTKSDRALLAWVKVKKCGADAIDSVVFDDPIIHAVIDDMGGWISFMDSNKWSRFENMETGELTGYTDQQFSFFQKEFIDRYQMRSRMGFSDAPKRLIGINELQNHDAYPELVAPPKMIGKPEPKRLMIVGDADKPLENLPEVSKEEVMKQIENLAKEKNV